MLGSERDFRSPRRWLSSSSNRLQPLFNELVIYYYGEESVEAELTKVGNTELFPVAAANQNLARVHGQVGGVESGWNCKGEAVPQAFTISEAYMERSWSCGGVNIILGRLGLARRNSKVTLGQHHVWGHLHRDQVGV